MIDTVAGVPTTQEWSDSMILCRCPGAYPEAIAAGTTFDIGTCLTCRFPRVIRIVRCRTVFDVIWEAPAGSWHGPTAAGEQSA